MLRNVLRWCFAPLFFLGFTTLALWSFSHSSAPIWLIPLGIVAISVSFLVESIVPYRREWNQNHGDRKRDFLHCLVNEGSAAASVASVPIVASVWPWAGLWPVDWPLWLQLAVAVGVADAGITVAHYISHRVNWLWQLHAVHHSAKRLYGFNGIMKHPVHQAIETLAGTAPLIVFGIPAQVAALLGFTILLQLLLQHSNVDMKIGPLRWFWAVAPVHRFHHFNKPGAGDVNFGLFLTFWDRLLRTAYYDDRREFTSADLGIANEPSYPTSYVQQLMKPFQRT